MEVLMTSFNVVAFFCNYTTFRTDPATALLRLLNRSLSFVVSIIEIVIACFLQGSLLIETFALILLAVPFVPLEVIKVGFISIFHTCFSALGELLDIIESAIFILVVIRITTLCIIFENLELITFAAATRRHQWLLFVNDTTRLFLSYADVAVTTLFITFAITIPTATPLALLVVVVVIVVFVVVAVFLLFLLHLRAAAGLVVPFALASRAPAGLGQRRSIATGELCRRRVRGGRHRQQ